MTRFDDLKALSLNLDLVENEIDSLHLRYVVLLNQKSSRIFDAVYNNMQPDFNEINHLLEQINLVQVQLNARVAFKENVRAEFQYRAAAFHAAPTSYCILHSPEDISCMSRVLRAHAYEEYFIARVVAMNNADEQIFNASFLSAFGIICHPGALYCVRGLIHPGGHVNLMIREATAEERVARAFFRV